MALNGTVYRAISIIFLAGLFPHPLRAEIGHAAKERVLEARIRSLEQRLGEMETKLEGREHRSSLKAPSVRPRPNPVAEASNSAAAEPVRSKSNIAATPAAPGLSAVEPNAAIETPQETFVFRENSVTLKPRHFEIDVGADYIRGSGFLQSDRALSAATSIRLGVLDWLEVNATIPGFTSTRTRGIGPFRTQSKQVSGFGDLALQANARLHEQTADTPGIVLSLGTLFPTGVRPYEFGNYQPNSALRGYNPNPTDFNAGYLSRGEWGLFTNLQFYKTVDPLILFFGAGVRYFLPQGIQGHTVQAGTAYTYNMGFTFAVSEKSTLGLQILGSYADKLSVDRHAVPQSELEPVSVRLSLIQRIFLNTWIEPSLGAGLTRDSPSLDIGFGIRHRF